ncbi:MAG: hypothetical protein A3J58_00125 [Candidatus Sungbacteria bacterium RIFCSPHIGHO2_02_FULL_52_23]|uniref:Uncharacterized protein n=1 Tax=Candidatus Sungbacteria bacterium RIFCSPHIGHO2_02_FULL_52_23 TaxID=1802274 RepID=A0A1G2KYZ4_9BACT|nr:MAG: hypothetical protein A3J58_00125 [Candidatus Sungbacteria bacterium RIFCSPHIGHO2_02_FULL_52_23]
MGTLLFLTDYVIWHYGRAPQDLLGIARNLLWSCWHFFSIPDLARTLFAPFARIRQTYFNINNLEESFQNLTANTVSRVVGLVLRTIVIVAGLVCEVILAGILVIVWTAWFLLPAIIVLFLILGSGIFA